MWNRKIALLLVLVGLCLFMAPRAAEAAPPSSEIVSIELTKHGPKSTFPTNQLFYVTGKVDEQPGKDETREIYAVFVRYWWGPWSLPPSGRAPKSCTEVEHALDGREVSRAHLQATKPKFRDIWSPTSTAGDPSKADADHFTWLTSQARVLVAKGAVDDSKRFAALANDPSFFHHGARYCVFVYRAERKTTEAIKAKLFSELRTEFLACKTNPAKQARADKLRCYEDKVKNAIGAFQRAVETQITDKEARKELSTALQTGVAGSYEDIWITTEELTQIDLAKPRAPDPWAPGTVLELGLGGTTPDANADFARLTLELLAQRGTVHRDVRTDGDVVYVAPGVFDVHAVAFPVVNDSVESIMLYGPKPAAAAKNKNKNKNATPVRPSHQIKLSLAMLSYPGVTGLSLEDIQALAAGVLPQTLVDVVALSATFQQKAKPTVAILANRAKVQSALESVERRIELLEIAKDASAGKMKNIADPLLSKWLASACGSANCATLAARYAEYRKNLNTLASRLQTLDEKADDLIAKTDEYVAFRVVFSPDISPTLSLTPKAHFDHFVSGYAGVGVSQYATGEVAVLPVVGAHLFLWPNEVTEPMWSNRGADIRRLVGLEYGVRANSGTFGPDGRYRGVLEGSLPVMFAGGVLQPLPYVFVSGGAMFSSYRRSIVAQERYQPRVHWYIGLTVDINLAGFIRNLITNGTLTAATPN